MKVVNPSFFTGAVKAYRSHERAKSGQDHEFPMFGKKKHRKVKEDNSEKKNVFQKIRNLFTLKL